MQQRHGMLDKFVHAAIGAALDIAPDHLFHFRLQPYVHAHSVLQPWAALPSRGAVVTGFRRLVFRAGGWVACSGGGASVQWD